MNDRLRVGGEYQFRNLPSGVQAALRAGLHKEWDTGERPAWAVGGSLGLSVSSYADVLFEYAYLDSPSLPGTHRFALRIPFDFNPKLVEIEKIEFPQADYMVSEVDSPVFISSLLPYHEKTHLATISLRNKRDKILAVSVKFTLPDYLKGTVVASDIALLPKSTVRTDRERKASAAPPEKVEIRALLPTEILTLKSSKNLTATIKVDYSGVERYTPVETSFSLTFIKPGLVPVNKGVQAFIPFIDPNDPIVQGFAQRIIAEYAQDGLRKTLLPSIEASEQSLFFLDKWRPLLNMMQIYESLRQFKVRYVPDAQSPYWARDNQSFDSVKYPGEFLTSAEKAGDCDDVSVLIAALCESVDVRTALVEVPGHVFVFVNTGLYSADTEGGYVSQCGILALPEERFVRVSGTGDPNWDHHLVIPLDASQQIDDTFIEAWEKGLKTYRANQGLAKLFIVRREHKNYPPVHPPQAPKSPPKIEDFKPIDDRIKRDMQTIIQWQQEHKSHLQAEVAGNFPDEMISLLLNRAKEQAQRGETDEAKETLRQADEIDKADKFTAIENNLGNIARIEGNFEEALIKYQHAHERAPDDAGILLNLALTHLGLGEKEAADKLLWRWKQKGGNIPEAARLLWVMPEPTSEVRGESVILERKLHALLETVKRAESVEDLRGEHLEFLKDEFLNPNSGMYWEAYKAR
ncbi:tetratricopeptide repeat protein [Candidatus Poribacteria bacterium]|nr:tetratricopeptide repeat protein [Candidatus Poribacteria bacterium]